MKYPSPGRLFRNLPRIASLFCTTYAMSFFKPSSCTEKVLIVKLDALGDQVLSACVIETIGRYFGRGRVGILVQPQIRDFYRSFHDLDSILVCDRRRYWTEPGYALSLVRTVREERYSIVVNAVYSRDVVGDQVAAASGAKRIIGLVGDTRNEPPLLNRIYNFRYTELIPDDPPEAFEGYRYLAIPRHFGVPMNRTDWKPRVRPTEENHLYAKRLLGEFGLSRKRFAVIAPGAGDPIKCWGASRFASIGDRLAREKHLEIVLAGAPGEEGLADSVSHEMRAPCKSAVGRTAPLELAALISNAALLVGNDSGPVHLAAGVGTPAICILGGGHSGRFLPHPDPSVLRCVSRRMECFDCNWECRFDEPRCITEVTAEEVWTAIEKLLGNATAT